MRTKLASNPYVVGAAIGLLLSLGIIASVLWFPWIGNARNKWWLDFLFFTAFLFSILISINWRFHKQPRLWISIAILAPAHTTGIFLFIAFVHPLKPIHYAFLIYFEAVIGQVLLQRFVPRSKKSALP